MQCNIGSARQQDFWRAHSTGTPPKARAGLLLLLAQIESASAELAKLDAELRRENAATDEGKRLMTIPGIGPVIASAIRARVGDAGQFANGRHLAAWLGLFPENDSSGGTLKQKGLSKKGDRYLRTLLVGGAMALVQHARRRPDKNAWITSLLGRKSGKEAAIAVANKNARIVWAILVRGETYQAKHRAAAYRIAAPAEPDPGGDTT